MNPNIPGDSTNHASFVENNIKISGKTVLKNGKFIEQGTFNIKQSSHSPATNHTDYMIDPRKIV